MFIVQYNLLSYPSQAFLFMTSKGLDVHCKELTTTMSVSMYFKLKI